MRLQHILTGARRGLHRLSIYCAFKSAAFAIGAADMLMYKAA